MSTPNIRLLIGVASLAGPGLHLVSDLMELASGGFTTIQLYINYAAFLIIPYMILGLHIVQAKRTNWLSLGGALAYGLSFIFFAGTTLYALLQETGDYSALLDQLGMLYTLHGVLMIVGGAMFSIAVIKAGVLPKWTGILLLLGVAINLIVGLFGVAEILQVAGSVLRNIAFIGMGATLVFAPQSSTM